MPSCQNFENVEVSFGNITAILCIRCIYANRLAVTIILAVCSLGLLLPACFGEPGRLLCPGQLAPVTGLTNLQGSTQSFPASASWNLVFFWSLFCHTCIEEIPILSSELEKIQNSQIKYYFVSLDTEKMKVAIENFLRKRNLKIPVLLEEIASDSYKTADLWGVTTTPAVFIVAPDGRVVFSREGPFDVDEILSILSAQLASETAKNGNK